MTASTFICVSTKDSTPIAFHRAPIIPISHKCHGLPEVVVACASDIARHSATAFPAVKPDAGECGELVVRSTEGEMAEWSMAVVLKTTDDLSLLA